TRFSDAVRSDRHFAAGGRQYSGHSFHFTHQGRCYHQVIMRLILCISLLMAHVLAAANSPAWQILTEAAAEGSGYKRAEAISALGTIRSAEADKFVVAGLR